MPQPAPPFKKHALDVLTEAVRDRNMPLLEAMLKQGVEINGRDRDGFTPLTWAAWLGHADIVQLLITKGADVNKTDGAGDSALTLAAFYGYVEIMQDLLNHGADLEYKNGDDGAPALVLSAGHGHEKAVKMLLDCGANIDAKDRHERTALVMASLNRHEFVVQLLQKTIQEREAREKAAERKQAEEAAAAVAQKRLAILKSGRHPGPKRNPPPKI